jgi:hypothetical protein
MPTRYFKNSVDQNWDTLGNWWANAACDEGFSGTLTGVNVTDTDTEVTCDSTAGLVVGRPITGDGVDTGTTVASITDGTTFELSQAAISTETSDLTCELHVIPVTGDDVVVATDAFPDVGGSPSADVLGTVTVNGSSKLEVTLAASSFVFNDTSMIEYYAALTGDATFNDNSFKATSVSFTGNGTFNDNSYNWGPLTGNCTFNDSSYNADGGTIIGNASFTNAAFSTATTGRFNPQQGAVSGTAAFPNGATFTLTGWETWSADTSLWTGTLAWVFNGSSTNTNIIYGPCTLNDTSSTATGSTIYGPCTFNGSSYHGAGTITGDVSFRGSSYNNFTGITGNVTFYNSSYNTANAITGNGIIRQSAAAFVTWRDYATSTYITGTLTLQFPEMDVLGTGLL